MGALVELVVLGLLATVVVAMVLTAARAYRNAPPSAVEQQRSRQALTARAQAVARWQPRHTGDGTTTAVYVARVYRDADGVEREYDARRIGEVADAAPDYERQFNDLMARARLRAELYNDELPPALGSGA